MRIIEKRIDFSLDEKVSFYEIVVRTYPYSLIETLFKNISEPLTKRSSDANDYGQKQMVRLVSILLTRHDLTPDSKIEILAMISKYYPSNFIAYIIRDCKSVIGSLPICSQILIIMVLNLFQLGDATVAQNKSVLRVLKGSYDATIVDEVNAGIKAFMKANDDSDLTKSYNEILID